MLSVGVENLIQILKRAAQTKFFLDRERIVIIDNERILKIATERK